MVGAATMQITKEGLSFGGIDSAGGMLSDIRINREAFESYTCTTRGFGIDVNFTRLAEDLNSIRDLDTLEISVETNAKYLMLFGNKDGVGVRIRIKVALLEIQGDRVVIQDVDYIAIARMQCILFRNAIASVKRHGRQIVALTISSSTTTFRTQGPMSDILATVPHENDNSANGQEGKHDLALPYLEAFGKIGSITGYVTISIPDNGATLFEFMLPEGFGCIRLHTSSQVDVEAIDV